MTLFKAAAAFAILLAGAGSAQAGGYVIDPGASATVDPSGFGGFESNWGTNNPTYSTSVGCTSLTGAGACTAYQFPSNWVASPSGVLNASGTNVGPVTWAVTKNFPSGNPASGSYALKTQNYSNTFGGLNSGGNTSGWTYVGLQNLAVGAGDLITVSFSAYFATTLVNAIKDGVGLVVENHGGITGSSTQLATTWSNKNFGQWYDSANSDAFTYSFYAPSSSIDINFGLDFANTGSPTAYDAIYLDNVGVYDAPEPASMALLGAGLLGLGLSRRRKGA